jgi:hypothetical protein
VRADLLQEGRSITFDRAAGVLLGESEIEGVAAIGAGRSGESGAESMNQPGNASEVFTTENRKSRFTSTLNWHPNILTTKVPLHLVDENAARQIPCPARKRGASE